jgi:hypothetical protein
MVEKLSLTMNRIERPVFEEEKIINSLTMEQLLLFASLNQYRVNDTHNANIDKLRSFIIKSQRKCKPKVDISDTCFSDKLIDDHFQNVSLYQWTREEKGFMKHVMVNSPTQDIAFYILYGLPGSRKVGAIHEISTSIGNKVLKIFSPV